ncbi:MAG: integrase [Alphaproteobacteria bacterium]|nr:integrase [Alphaproteobacteria bacterium]
MVKPLPAAPGLKRKRNRDGTYRFYWQARSDLVTLGYRPSSLRLSYPDTPEGDHQRAAKCRVLWAEMLVWEFHGGAFPKRGFDGTIASLCRLYQTDDISAYQNLKWNSRKTIDDQIKILVSTVGSRLVGNLTGADFIRWHKAWGAPKVEGGKPRLTRAYGCIAMIRAVVKHGAICRYPGCRETSNILSDLRFKNPPPRTVKLEYHHAVAIIEAAHKLGLHSVSLAEALQFECAFRQKDVIGEWMPGAAGAGGIRFKDRLWMNGLVWTDIDADLILRKDTIKKDVPVEHDLRKCPLVLQEIERIPPERRIGPMIISERTGEPYKHKKFSEAFARVRKAAGVPSNIWNMDSRAGAISEAYDGGASETEAMKMAAHQDPKMSQRYNRGSLEQSNRAHDRRLEERKRKGAKGRLRDV